LGAFVVGGNVIEIASEDCVELRESFGIAASDQEGGAVVGVDDAGQRIEGESNLVFVESLRDAVLGQEKSAGIKIMGIGVVGI
jgi:hypothetical protein